MAKRKDKSGVVINAKGISGLFDNISEFIDQSRQRVVYHLNSEMVSVNWYIGKLINETILQYKRGEYGKSVMSGLSEWYGNNFSSFTWQK